jgi:hypothetical protein
MSIGEQTEEQTEVGEAEEAEFDWQSLVSRRCLPGDMEGAEEKEQGWEA